jgi:hypothetical protein
VTQEWFIYSDNVVTGPFTTEQVDQCLSAGIWSGECFVWWKGQREWMPVKNWKEQLATIVKNESEKSQSPVWYVDVGGSSVGPLTQKEMISHLRGVANLNKTRLWSVGLDKWTNIFELHEVMEELGISRRENDRAPLMGTVAISRADQQGPVLVKAASVSIAGMGCNDAGFLVKGEQVQLIIKSNEFPTPLRVTGSVAYVTAQGYAGIRFDTLHPETSTVVFDYVKRFNTPLKKSA